MRRSNASISRRAAAAAACALLFVTACSDDGDPSTSADPTSDTVSVSAEASPYSTIAAEVSISGPDQLHARLVATSGDHVVETPRTATAATDHALPLVGLRAERTYDVEVTLTDPDGDVVETATTTFEAGSLPDDFLDFELTAEPDRMSPGYTIVEVNGGEEVGEYLMALDADGEIVWYYRNTGVVGGVEPTPDGTFISHYWPIGVRELDVLGRVLGNWQFENPQAGQDAVVDEDLREGLEALFGGNPGDPDPLPIQPDAFDMTSIHHEAHAMPDGNLLVLGTTLHDLTPEQQQTFCPGDDVDFQVISDVVVEIERDGTVVRTWDLWDAIDVDEVPGDEMCADEGPFAASDQRDWLHANAVIYDEARDAIIVSNRHTSNVIALRHLDEEGPQSEVLWVFGDQGATVPLEGDVPRYQHAPEVEGDGSILLYDNGNDREGTAVRDPDSPTYSRAVLYEVDDTGDDPGEWSVRQVWEHRTDDVDGSPLYARFLGDADRLENGNVLITHGGIDMPEDDDYQHAVLIEVVPDGAAGGEEVWRLEMGTPDQPVTVYRSERIPSFYFGPDWETEAG